MNVTPSHQERVAERPCVLLTGATGYLGKHILRYLLKEGWQVAVIVRGQGTDPVKRIDDVLAPMGRYDMCCIDVFKGDLLEPDCGLDASSMERLAKQNIKAWVHCAGLAHSEAWLDKEVLRKNTLCTRNAFELSAKLKIRNFLHMSSAFVAGNSSELFSQAELDVGQAFTNRYEQSKYAEEHYLREQSELHPSSNIRIYRPSVVVGGAPDSKPGQASSIYAVLKTLHYLRDKCLRDLQRGYGKCIQQGVSMDRGRLVMPLRIAADAKTRINLVSMYQVVNEVIADLNRVLGNGIDRFSSKSLLGQDFSLQDLLTLSASALRLTGTEFVDEGRFELQPRSGLENFFRRTTTGFKPYLFTRRQYPEPEKNYVYHIDIKSLVQSYCGQLDKSSGKTDRPAGVPQNSAGRRQVVVKK